jgi:cytochrome P450
MSLAERTPTRQFRMLIGGCPEDPFEYYNSVGAVPPFWTESPEDIDGYWVVTRYQDIRQVLQDTSAFSSTDAMIPHFVLDHPMLPSEVDPPDVNRYRGIVLPHMTADKIDPLEAKMHSVAREIISDFRNEGRCDVVRDFARVFPIRIFVEFFGLPTERREEFRNHAETFLHSAPRRTEAWGAIRGILSEQLTTKRESPQADLLSAIGNGRLDGELIDLETATNLASTVFLGGLDTLPSNIAWSLRFLAQHPERRRQIVEAPSITPDAVEEFLRYFSVANPRRRAVRDVEVGGSLIRKNDRVFVLVFLGNRDPHEFGDAESVRFDRDPNRHVAFGAGPHRCLGSHLARHELVVALNEWHAQIPEYWVDREIEQSYQGGVLAMDSLHIRWEP